MLLPRRLKDRVSRALSPAEGPSPRSLTMFIAAFDIPTAVADQLWAAHLGEAPVEQPRHDAPPAVLLQLPTPAAPRPGCV